MTGSGTNFQEKDDNFKLEEKVTAKSQSIKLMQEGFLQAYVDFFYITTETTPSSIVPSKKLQEEYKLNRIKKGRFVQTESSLLDLSDKLKMAEQCHRIGVGSEKKKEIEKCLSYYTGVAEDFNSLCDYETASYFFNRCLEVSIENKDDKGEALALQGLGKCEENVLNIFEAQTNLERARDKAVQADDPKITKDISRDLVRVYQIIALDFQEKNDYDLSLKYFEKCLESSQKAENKDQESECYQKIAHIYEKLNDLDKAVEFLNKFLALCEETDQKSKAGDAHKQLAEVHQRNGNVHQAFKHLDDLLNIANEEKKYDVKAEAFLKLGLLNYQEGIIRRSVDCLQEHFKLARAVNEDQKNQKQIDKARVNLGIAQANTQIENYKYIVLNDLN